MPTYEYHCPNGHEFEVFQRMSDDPLSECPECGAGAERQISGGAGFLFKGDGFYITDNRSEDYKKKASADSSSSGSSKESSKESPKESSSGASSGGSDSSSSSGSSPSSGSSAGSSSSGGGGDSGSSAGSSSDS